jgi:hypothetical protein
LKLKKVPGKAPTPYFNGKGYKWGARRESTGWVGKRERSGKEGNGMGEREGGEGIERGENRRK